MDRFTRKIIRVLTSVAFVIVASACSDDSSVDSNAEKHAQRAESYQTHSQYRAAAIEWRNAIKKSSDKKEYLYDYARMLLDMGNSSAAVELLNQLDGEISDDYRLLLAEAYIEIGKARSALAVLDEVSDSSSSQFFLNKSKALMLQSQYAKARDVLNELVQKQPQNVMALGALARIAFTEGKVAESEQYIDRMTEIDPESGEAKILKAGILVSQENLEDAEKLLTQALAQQPNADVMLPDRAMILERLSYVLTRLGRLNEAYVYNKLLSEAYPGAEEASERYEAALALFRSGKLDESYAELQKLIEAFPGFQSAIQLAGVIEFSRGNFQEASTYLSSNFDAELASPVATHAYAAATLQLDDPARVVELLEPELNSIKIPQTLEVYGIAAASVGELGKAESAFKRAIEIDPDSIRSRLALASIYSRSTDADDSLELEQLQSAYAKAPLNRDVLSAFVGFYIRNQNVAKANAFLNEAIKNNPNSHNVNLVKGYFEVNRKQYQKALPLFETAVRRAQGPEENYLGYTALGGVLLALKEYGPSEDAFSNAIVADPSKAPAYEGLLRVLAAEVNGKPDPKPLYELGQVHQVVVPYATVVRNMLANNELSEARRAVDLAGTQLKQPDKSLTLLEERVRFAEAMAAFRAGNLDVARERISGLVGAYPDNLQIQGLLLEIEIASGNESQAASLIKQLEQFHPDHLGITVSKGDLAARSGNITEAIGYYEAVWAASPAPLVAEKLVSAYFKAGSQDKRDNMLEQWRNKFPDDLAGLVLQTVRYQELGKTNEAVSGYESILKIDPNQITALNNLGWIYYERRQFEDALALLEKAVELAPELPAVLDSYGWVLVESGDAQKGIVYLEKAVSLAPEARDIQAHLEQARSKQNP